MEYKKQNFENDEILSAEQLNYMEDGMAELYEVINNLQLAIQDLTARLENIENNK